MKVKNGTGRGGAGDAGGKVTCFFKQVLEGWCLTSGVQPSSYYPRWRTKKKKTGGGRGGKGVDLSLENRRKQLRLGNSVFRGLCARLRASQRGERKLASCLKFNSAPQWHC